MKVFFTFLIVLLVSVSCTSDEVTMDSLPVCETEVSYDADIQSIMGSNCAGCHTAGGNFPPLTTYDEVKAQLDRVKQRAVILKDMPPSGALPAADIEKINCWVEQNAPKN